MMKGRMWLAIIVMVLCPQLLFAQGLPEHIRGLHGILDKLHKDMLPLCSQLIGVGRALAGFAAIFYIGARVWKHIAAAEPIDFYPLFRPFVLGFCILNFTSVIALAEAILSPIKDGTFKMVDGSNKTVERLIEQREKERRETISYRMYGANDGAGDRDLWMQYEHGDVQRPGLIKRIGYNIEFAMSKAYYNLKNWIKDFVAFVLQLLYEAAALCINTLRTFYLLILAILGPIVFGLAVFDGFQHTLTVYLARYVNYYLWLPIANIVGSMLNKIQEEMIQLDLKQLASTGDTFFSSTDVGYLIFMVIGIVCYFTIPSMANLVVNTGGGSPLASKLTGMLGGASRTGGSGAGMAADAFGDINLMMSKGTSSHGTASGYFGDKISGKS